MPSTIPRKRPAPGASPVLQSPQISQTYSAGNQLLNDQFLRWSQDPENTSNQDPSDYNMANYTGNAMSQAPYEQSLPAASNQLARRPMSRQLVSTAAPRPAYDNTGGHWDPFGDESLLDPLNSGGVVEDNDNIELLEERAALAKRDAQSKRKQIPPFVQKLSR